MTQGVFIAFEGIDGSGKTTQCKALYDFCTEKKINAVHLVEPTAGEKGKKIRTILSGKDIPPVQQQLEMFLDDRADDVRDNIAPALAEGKIILMDRYCFSNAAYQGALGLSWKEILRENQRRMFPFPDYVFFIDISVETAMQRITARNGTQRDIFEKKNILQNIYDNYHEMKDDSFIVIDGSSDEHSVFEQVKNEFLRCIQ